MAPSDPAPALPEGLLKAYRQRHFALGLGAGVSKASGLPDWQELLCRVADALPGFGRESAEQLLKQSFDATAVATILRSRAEGDRPFADLVRDALYRHFTYPSPLKVGLDADFASHIRRTNGTLHAVGTLCAVRAADDKFEPNPLLRAVVTLNMDALLQMYTRARFGHIVRTTERASASASRDKVHCYHLHGYMKRQAQESHREAPDRLVLTEQQYFDVVANVHGFVTYALLHLLREHRFLFIGLSMSDPNLRRALYLSCKERTQELRAEERPPEVVRSHAIRHWAVLQRQGDPAIDSATETLLHIVGVEPLWVSSHAEIPILMKTLYESTGARWSDVE
jgi:hypothetical protein